MGLDIEPGGASWSYPAFDRFRRRLAELEGINLESMQGYAYEGEVPRSWDTVITSLKPLLDHSDCEGTISWQDCKKMIPCLQEIQDLHGSEPVLSQLEWLINGMRYCVLYECDLEFE